MRKTVKALWAAVAALAMTRALGAETWPDPKAVPRWQGTDAWREADFALPHSELSPAVLVSAKSRTLRLFAGLGKWGLAGPTRLVFRRPEGVREQETPATITGEDLAEAWLCLSFRGAPGWPWDVPWLVVLQHRPKQAVVEEAGLRLDFEGEAGLVALMPLYGAHKGALEETSGEMGERCRAWARVLRYWPIDCREEVQVVPGEDALRVRCRFRYVEIADDWGTEGLKVAPVPPTLALALRTGFPARLIGQPEKTELPTAYGPYAAVRGDRYQVEYPLLRYVNETETQQPANTDDPVVALAAQRVAEVMTSKFTDGSEDRIWDHGGGGNYCWQVMGDRYYPKALAYTPEPARSNAIASMRAYFRGWVLNPERYQPFREKLLLVGPGIGTWGGYDDAGKFSSNVLETLWCYAYYTGDWDLVRERWDMVRKLFITPREMRWRGVGRDAIAEMGDEAAPPLCMARMAYQTGDLDTYAYASSLFVRELVHLWVKTEPECGEWFRALSPWHTPEPMAGRLFLTNLWGDIAGWQIDGPGYPKETGERQYRNRWVRFGNEDVARFFRDHMGQQVREELDWWATREDSPYKPAQSTAHIAPSIEQLRSLLLNERPSELARIAPMEEARIGRAADAISYYLSFIRTGRETRYTRLVPQELPTSPWVLGLEREAEGSDGDLVAHLATAEGQWPVLSDWGWSPPQEAGGMPGGKRWSYGQIVAGDEAGIDLEYERLNWVTECWYGG